MMEVFEVLHNLPVWAALIVIAGVVLTGLSFLEILARVGPRPWLAPAPAGGEDGREGSRGPSRTASGGSGSRR
jgi:hypothetical protein